MAMGTHINERERQGGPTLPSIGRRRPSPGDPFLSSVGACDNYDCRVNIMHDASTRDMPSTTEGGSGDNIFERGASSVALLRCLFDLQSHQDGVLMTLGEE